MTTQLENVSLKKNHFRGHIRYLWTNEHDINVTSVMSLLRQSEKLYQLYRLQGNFNIRMC